MKIRLPVATIMSHTSRAISFMELDPVYFGLGKTSPWEGEIEAILNNDPDFQAPKPSVYATELDGLIGMKKVDMKSLVIPDDEGSIIYRDRAWRRINKEEAIATQCHWVYLEASIYYEDLPEVQYRQIGVFSNVTLNDDVPANKSILLPEDIKNTGILEVIDQRKVVTRNEDSRDLFSMIIEL